MGVTVGGSGIGVTVSATLVGVGVRVGADVGVASGGAGVWVAVADGVGVAVAADSAEIGVGAGSMPTLNWPSSRSTRTPCRPLGISMVNSNGAVAPAAKLIGCTASIVSSIHSFAG